MNHRMSNLLLLAIACSITTPLISQQPKYSPFALERQHQIEPRAQSPPEHGHQLYQRRDTWYEFLLKQFNPDDCDYGAWIEERRQTFLDASAHNAYFKYCWALSSALILMALL